MKTLLKSLIVWLMLLAVPLQGFASATMLFCAPMQPAALEQAMASSPAAPHDHQAMLAAERAGQHATGHEANADTSAGHQASGKCNSCATCCFGASMPPTQAVRMPVDTQQFAAVPFEIGFVPTVDPALPERPPQVSLN